jgi:2,3-dihydroxybiphenyl 1,2-dioxygenase
MIEALGYFGITGASLDEWSSFCTKILGTQVADRTSSSMALRLDERASRIFLDGAQGPWNSFFGWEVASASALESLASRLERAQVAVIRASGSLIAQRGVKDLIFFEDPAGNRLEAFYGAQVADAPFVPGRAISGFRTGALGLGHVVLTVERIETVRPFYENLLGFRLSDYTLAPFKAYFFHINRRHHSIAMIETGKNGVHHLMLEVLSLDDVGQGYDLALEESDRVSVTLGRHSNDHMTSFYLRSPASFLIEYGWGGCDIEPSGWEPRECVCGPSLWGHERSWLAPKQRREARDLRLEAAARGHREPVHVLEGHYTVLRSED